MNSLLLDALHYKNLQRPPVWFMRQAGRYLPEYQALKKGRTLYDMFHDPKLIVDVTMQPVDILGVDAAILFSDILIVFDALGIEYEFQDKIGPVIKKPIDFAKLQKRDVKESLWFVFEGIRNLRKELKVPLIGFAGAPFTVATYLLELSKRELADTKKYMYSEPESFKLLLDKLFEVILEYVDLQVENGAQAIQIFDSWAGLLSYPEFKKYSLSYLERLVKERKHQDVPMILFCRNSSLFAQELSALKPHGISIDWGADMLKMRSLIPAPIALQGNLDPSLFHGSLSNIENEAKRLMDGMKNDPGYIFNLGHGIHPDVPVEKVKHLIQYVKSY